MGLKELTTMQREPSLSSSTENCYILGGRTLPKVPWEDLGGDRKDEVGVRHVRLRSFLELKTWVSQQRQYEKFDQI